MSYTGSAIVLSLVFLVFIFSNFNPNYHFGVVVYSVSLPAFFMLIDIKKESRL